MQSFFSIAETAVAPQLSIPTVKTRLVRQDLCGPAAPS